MYIKVYLAGDLLERMITRSVQERRPLPMQAEVELRRAVGMSAPSGSLPAFEVVEDDAGLETREIEVPHAAR